MQVIRLVFLVPLAIAVAHGLDGQRAAKPPTTQWHAYMFMLGDQMRIGNHKTLLNDLRM